jgi:hypothetical protein
LLTSFLQPAFKLKAQQIALPAGSLCWKPLSSCGHKVFAFVDGFAFLAGLTGPAAPDFGTEGAAVVFSVSFALLFGSGNKSMVTLGSVRNSRNFKSIGSSPR